MHLCYVDESGFNRKGFDKNQPVQVMAGIFPNVYNFHKSDAECKEIFKIIHDVIPLKEVKAREIYRAEGKWKNISARQRDAVIEYYFKWLRDRNHKVILTAIDNNNFFEIIKDESFKDIVNSINHPYLLGGIHIALVIQKLNRNKKNNKGKTLLIFDEQDKFEDTLTDLIFEPPEFIDEFVKFDEKNEKSRLNQIIDTAFFVKSHQSAMAQVVDIVSYFFRLYLLLNHYGYEEKYTGEKDKIIKWIKMVENKLLIEYPNKKSHFIEFLNLTKAHGI